jgi:glycerophosphoryl diester phosphodiesterase
MFRTKGYLDHSHGLWLLIGCLVWVGLAAPFNAVAQTTQTVNYNPNNYDAQKIVQAFQQNYSDLTLLSAHRGLHALSNINQTPYVPENSLQAVEWAAREGYEAIELDVRLTSDGTPILTHDKSWGREWCYVGPGPGYQIFDPFSPNTGQNALANPAVGDTPYGTLTSTRNGTVLRDSVSLVNDTSDHGCTITHVLFGEFPPTLSQVYDDMKSKGIQAAVMLDVQSPDAALAAYNEVLKKTDSKNRPALNTTIFKMPADMFATPSDFRSLFKTGYENILWIPVITTRMVAPTSEPATFLPEDGGYDVAALAGGGFGSETAISNWIDLMMSTSSAGQIVGIEVVMKESGGILSTVLDHVGSINNQWGQPMTIGNFNPVGEYYPYGPTQEPQYFRSSNGTCCDYLEAYLYNNPNSIDGVVDPGGQQDNSDIRRNFPFIFRTGVPRTNFVTTDDPMDAAKYLGPEQRNWREHLVADGATVANNTVVLSLGASQPTANIGDTVHLLAALSDGLATGSVTFLDGSTTLATVSLNGLQSASLDVTETTAGTHTYTATYSGDSTYSASSSNSVTVNVNANSTGGATTSTCDIYASGGTPCVAAHSTVRALFGTYSGRLYQVQRASDGQTKDISTANGSTYADASSQDSFCVGTTCTITKIYDQTSYHNDMPIEGAGGGAAPSADSGAVANALPIQIGPNKTRVYGVLVTPGVGYRNDATTGVAKGSNPEGMYMVTSGTNYNSACCFDYGNVEESMLDEGRGTMDALNFGSACIQGESAPCNGSGPWVEVDLENGQWMGNGSNPGDLSMGFDFVTAMHKNDGQANFALKGGDAQSGGLITDYSGSLPVVPSPGYIPMNLKGGIVLGTGGDNSNSGTGSFFEGAMTAGYPTDATEDAVQENIVAAGYNGNSGGASGDNGGTYTGPSDPNGPGPQDGFLEPAREEPNDILGSKPALASFEGSLYVAFMGLNAGNNLFVASSQTGSGFPTATMYGNVKLGSAPALAAFNGSLYVAFMGLNAGNNLFVTSSASGVNFPTATMYSNIKMAGAPALAVFGNKLCMSFRGLNVNNTLFLTCSTDGVNWPTAHEISNVQMGSDPAMAVFNGNFYIAFKSNDANNGVWIASSSDGVNFTSQVLPNLSMGGKSSPALVASNGVLYYIYGANDGGNEMLVMASTDGSTWQGPHAYLGVQMGATGPAAAAFGGGVSVGLQANDSREVLYMTSKVTEASTYTGPSDPGGPGPQDGFGSPAVEGPNDIMGSRPALASYNGSLYLAFMGLNVGNKLFVASSSSGSSFPTATMFPNIQLGSAPALASFNGSLYLAFLGYNAGNNLFVTSSSSGSNFPTATMYSNIKMAGAPAMAVFNNQLCLSFRGYNVDNTLFVTCSSDGVNWPTAVEVPNVQMGSDPAMAVLNGKLYVAFKGNDANNGVWIASSSDAIHFSSQVLPNLSMGWNSTPALVASNGALYYIYGANDSDNEMMVMASGDGSTWQGPKAYTGIQMGVAGLAAAAFGNGVTVGFQANDGRRVLYMTNKVTEASTYAGPSDPGGSGPQDGFFSPAYEQAKDIMGSKPALALFSTLTAQPGVFVAFRGYNAGNNLFVTSSESGGNLPSATMYPNIQVGSAPAMAQFNNKLYLAFMGYNAGNNLFVTSSSSGSNFPTATMYSNIQMDGAPAMAVFNKQLCLSFRGFGSGRTLFVTCSSDGVSWPTAWAVSNVQMGSDPAMAVLNGKLYVAFKSNDANNGVWIASSSDGHTFSSQVLPNLSMGGSSSPALAVDLNRNTLYYIYGADDLGNEMMVMASTDGSTWQGPKAYLGIQMGATGPAACPSPAGIDVGFQSNDSRNVLYVTGNNFTQQ